MSLQVCDDLQRPLAAAITSGIEIRPPHAEDAAVMVDVGAAFHASSWYAHLPYDSSAVHRWVLKVIEDQEKTRFCRLALRNGIVVGAVAGAVQRYWFSSPDVTAVSDILFYVIPKERGTRTAWRLWHAMRDWAQSRGAAELTHGVATDINPDVSDRFFRGVGMRRVGGIYKLPLSPRVVS